MNYKRVNRGVYNRYAKRFEEETGGYLRKYILSDAESFIARLPGRDILDLGSGPGRDSAFFKEMGLSPFCFDFSPKMIELCRKKGLPAMVGDMEKIPFQNNSFHGVWAYTSLLHMPKTKLSPVLERIDRILTPQGMFYIGMKEGDFEGWISNERYRGDKRFFSLYSHEELIKTLSKKFDIVHHSKITLGKKVYLNYLCKKNGFGV